MKVNALIDRWLADAEVLRRNGCDSLASLNERHASELEAAIAAHDDEPLTLEQGASESGLSVDRLRHKIADGELPNAGRKGAPRIRRGDLPRKRTKSPDVVPFDAGAAARRVLGRAG